MNRSSRNTSCAGISHTCGTGRWSNEDKEKARAALQVRMDSTGGSTQSQTDLARPEDQTTRVLWPGWRGTGRSPRSTVSPLQQPTPPIGPFTRPLLAASCRFQRRTVDLCSSPPRCAVAVQRRDQVSTASWAPQNKVKPSATTWSLLPSKTLKAARSKSLSRRRLWTSGLPAFLSSGHLQRTPPAPQDSASAHAAP